MILPTRGADLRAGLAPRPVGLRRGLGRGPPRAPEPRVRRPDLRERERGRRRRRSERLLRRRPRRVRRRCPAARGLRRRRDAPAGVPARPGVRGAPGPRRRDAALQGAGCGRGAGGALLRGPRRGDPGEGQPPPRVRRVRRAHPCGRAQQGLTGILVGERFNRRLGGVLVQS